VYRPHGFGLALVEIGFLDLVAQFVLEGLQDGFDEIETSRRLFPFLVPLLR